MHEQHHSKGSDQNIDLGWGLSSIDLVEVLGAAVQLIGLDLQLWKSALVLNISRFCQCSSAWISFEKKRPSFITQALSPQIETSFKPFLSNSFMNLICSFHLFGCKAL